MENIILTNTINVLKPLVLTEAEHKTMVSLKEICYASAEDIFNRSKFSFDEMQKITGDYKEYRWGSDADRSHRKRIVKKAIELFSKSPLNYITAE